MYAVSLAVCAAVLIRAFFFEPFRIPTSSMERSLLVGDFVLVSKLHYGPRLPATIGLPFTDQYLHGWELPYGRLPGLGTVGRGDVIVFNYPEEDEPLDRKTHYIKRVVALPGDTLAIVAKRVQVNGVTYPLGEDMQWRWIVRMRQGERFPIDRADGLHAPYVRLTGQRGAAVIFEGTTAGAEAVAGWEGVESIAPALAPFDLAYGMKIFPEGSGYDKDRYGPLYVPAKGDTIPLNAETWAVYGGLIAHHEGHTAEQRGPSHYEIDGQRADQYVFSQDYFFVMGDNRDNSEDSRFWGFVPEDHLVGKAMMVYFSWDARTGNARLDRFFRLIR